MKTVTTFIAKNKKYVIATLIFAIWITFLDQNNLITRWKLNNRIKNMEADCQHYINLTEQNKRKIEELKSDTESLEKFAREEYLMKKSDEVVFVVKD